MLGKHFVNGPDCQEVAWPEKGRALFRDGSPAPIFPASQHPRGGEM